MTDSESGLLPISTLSRDTQAQVQAGESTSESSDISAEFAQPHGMSEMNGSRKAANETHRGMKSRHLTMIGMYPSDY